MEQSKKVQRFFALKRQLWNLGKNIMRPNKRDKNLSPFSLSLAEIYICSKKISSLIERLGKKDVQQLTVKDADTILSYVTDLEIQIEEFKWWAKDLKKPLAVVSEETARKCVILEKKAGLPEDHDSKKFRRRMQYARKKIKPLLDAIKRQHTKK